MTVIEHLKVKHPDFKYRIQAPRAVVFIFDRAEYLPVPRDQLEKFEADKAIVEAHGGHMMASRWQLAGKAPAFTAADVEAMLGW